MPRIAESVRLGHDTTRDTSTIVGGRTASQTSRRSCRRGAAVSIFAQRDAQEIRRRDRSHERRAFGDEETIELTTEHQACTSRGAHLAGTRPGARICSVRGLCGSAWRSRLPRRQASRSARSRLRPATWPRRPPPRESWSDARCCRRTACCARRCRSDAVRASPRPARAVEAWIPVALHCTRWAGRPPDARLEEQVGA